MKTDYAAAYGQLHAKGKYFPGNSIGPYVDSIAALVEQHNPASLLDYGCGRGLQYLKRRVHERWGGLLPHCYDIGVNGLNEKPEGQFGGVICTDMMEHIDTPDVPAILSELLGFVEPGGFLFLGISCRPTKKKLPDGRDVHLTIQPPSWWIDQINIARSHDRRNIHVVANWDIAGHFPDPETPWDSQA